jgi:P-type E1-E2 ATPase
MIAIDIPGFGDLRLKHAVLDFKGTLAVDGTLRAEVPALLEDLAQELALHVVTADTFGRAQHELAHLPVSLTILHTTGQAEAKRQYVQRLGPATVVAVGNGRNDVAMLQAAALGIAVIQGEGCAQSAIACSDVVVTSIAQALELLKHPLRLVATLRT